MNRPDCSLVNSVDMPAHWASWIINGDGSGLSFDEKQVALDTIRRETDGGAWTIVDCDQDSERFTWHYRLYVEDCRENSPVGGSVMTYRMIRSCLA